ncbi:L-histidine N(alpha)-methyltransferase [Sediminitomix flava]|uniref:Dimethylhistidine N-methyltransferase n=1 Tax=Sediminitomix flava TaxID=379075 RepID=A0A315ZB46_SEDFL|nr:L-histidine N(alpha)-methyltransferase [Sediminitomix flava]PWJ42580.1 dimethylhistidine N-methyltransferase [Sediminitomix flava]
MAIYRNKISEINLSEFGKEVLEGFSQSPKSISSKFFYNDKGSQIFREIMDMPEYYLTNCEFEILQNKGNTIFEACQFDQTYRVVELGAGDGLKTTELLRHFLTQDLSFNFSPIDISSGAIQTLEAKLKKSLPKLKFDSLIGDYYKELHKLSQTGTPTLLLFLGSNIGNYKDSEVIDLLKLFASNLKKGDKLLTGFDLKKNPQTIKLAYDDPKGITRAFNMNLLDRMQEELGAEIDQSKFDFYSHYDPISGEVKSYLVSIEKQDIFFRNLQQHISFEKNELIYTELSKKYDLEQIEKLAAQTGFEVVEHFFDSKGYFVDSLWKRS